MALKTSTLARATAVAAAFSLLATPVAAAELPRPAQAKAYDSTGENVQRHRNRRWRDRNDIDAGDVIAGVLVLGTIAAIAGAAKKDRQERYPERYPLPDDGAGYQTPGQYDRNRSQGMDRAVDMCVDEIERGADRVASVDGATRDRDGWRVSGELDTGAAYSCRIGNDGRISDIDVSGAYDAGYSEPSDGQWNDDDYARAREAQGVPPPLPEEDDGRYDIVASGGAQ
ncbi:MAG TPA: hypothetical protein VEB68_13975 [Croceibacterium sp.]|nr:hypothetical protein [Croceibacterium sp.]